MKADKEKKNSVTALRNSLFVAAPLPVTGIEPEMDTLGLAESFEGVGNPGSVVSMYVSVDEIDYYQYNPRTSENASYEDIKNSIRDHGLDQSLPISREEQGRYFIYKGGNSRLRALKELWQETRNSRYQFARCEFHPFQGHVEAIAAHMRENELRGPMSFIERAAGVMLLRAELEVFYGQALSLRSLHREIGRLGLTYSASHLSRFEYAVSLKSSIPLVLAAGAGKPLLVALRDLETAALSILRYGIQHSLFDENSISVASGNTDEKLFRKNIFGKALASTDRSDGWTIDDAEGAIQLFFMDMGMSVDDWRILFAQAMSKSQRLGLARLKSQKSEVPATDSVEVAIADGVGDTSKLKPSAPASKLPALDWNPPNPLPLSKGSKGNKGGSVVNESEPEVEKPPVSEVDGTVEPAVVEKPNIHVSLFKRRDAAMRAVARLDVQELCLPDCLLELVEICRLMAENLGLGDVV